MRVIRVDDLPGGKPCGRKIVPVIATLPVTNSAEMNHLREALASGDVETVQTLVVDLSLSAEYADAFPVCAELATHTDAAVRAIALLGLGHVARRFRRLDRFPAEALVARALRDSEAIVVNYARDAARDIRQFADWTVPGLEELEAEERQRLAAAYLPLLELSLPISALAEATYGLDSPDAAGVSLDAGHVRSVLERFLRDEVSADDVRDWADLVSARGLLTDAPRRLHDIIESLRSRKAGAAVTDDRARGLMARLRDNLFRGQ